MRFINKKIAFTLTEVLLAVAIVGIIAALVLPALVTKFHDDLLKTAATRSIQSIQGVIDQLEITENVAFHNSMMYVDADPDSYADNSGKFLKKYMRISKYCGDSNGDCFADNYYEYAGIQRNTYLPPYKGACASLKDGSSICLEPQVGQDKIKGLLDVNGPKGPNVKDRDLVEFSFEPRDRVAYDKKSDGSVFVTEVSPLVPETDPCAEDPNGYECCKTKTAEFTPGHPCCSLNEFKETQACKPIDLDPCKVDEFSQACCETKSPSSYKFANKKCCEYSSIAKKYPAYCNRNVSVELKCVPLESDYNDRCMDLCEGHGGWNPGMNSFYCAYDCHICCRENSWSCKLVTSDKKTNDVYSLNIAVNGTQMFVQDRFIVTNKYDTDLIFCSATMNENIVYDLYRNSKRIPVGMANTWERYGPFGFSYRGPVD